MRAGGRGWKTGSAFRTWVLRTYVIGLCLASLPGLGLSAGASYSRAGKRRVCNEQCFCRASRRPFGAALQPGRDDAVAGDSIHGRGARIGWIDEFHQPDRRNSSW